MDSCGEFVDLPAPQWFLDVLDELVSARAKHPRPRYVMTALTEELGELAKAILHTVDENEKNAYAKGDVRMEAIQVISTVVRLLEEGDESLGLEPQVPDDVFYLARNSP